MNNNIINIINFIRAIEPRPGRQIDLFEPMREQMALAKKYNLPTTWLLQYDALVQGPFVEFLKNEMPEDHEIGIWFEAVQPNVEAAGAKWNGRWPWDWHTNVGFSVGYTPEERERIADVFVAKFVEIFGYGPKSMGSWLFDAHLLEYLHTRYGIESACNCKDQYGTDGYTLWGGYWANAYYPSKKNSYIPAQHKEAQIPVPVFRMLGSDPLYQYSGDIFGNGQIVVTLEPVYTKADGGGGIPAWVDWFLKENFREPHLAMAYAQAGQENSFGWPSMGAGLTDQYPKIAAMRDRGEVRVETLAESGRWFRDHFPETPASAVITLDDWRNENRAGIWYLSKFGRLNLFRTHERELIIRDWQIFDEDYAEPFLNDVCTTPACTYDAFPVIDQKLKGAEIHFPGGPGKFGNIVQLDPDTLQAEWLTDGGETIRITLKPDTLEIEGQGLQVLPGALEIAVEDNKLNYAHNGFTYGLEITCGSVERNADGIRLKPVGGKLCIKF